MSPTKKTAAAEPSTATATAAGSKTADGTKSDIDEILKTLVFLYTENRRLTKEIAARASLTGPQLTVVKMLESMGDLSLSELSDAIRAQNSTVTGIIDRMEREELVERIRSTQDRRVVYIRLTDKGKKLALEIPHEPIVIFRKALEALTAHETKEALKLVTKITARFRAAISRQLKTNAREDEGDELRARTLDEGEGSNG